MRSNSTTTAVSLSVTSVCNTFFEIRFLSKRQSSYCLIHFRGSSGAAWGSLTEDDLLRKTTFDERQPLTEDDLLRKTTFDGRRPLTEDDLWRNMTFDGIWPLTEDDLWRMMTFDRRWPLAEDNLWRKTTFDGRLPLTEDDLKKIFTTPHLDSHSTTDPKPEILSVV